jgi:hypothetical protein
MHCLKDETPSFYFFDSRDQVDLEPRLDHSNGLETAATAKAVLGASL